MIQSIKAGCAIKDCTLPRNHADAFCLHHLNMIPVMARTEIRKRAAAIATIMGNRLATPPEVEDAFQTYFGVLTVGVEAIEKAEAAETAKREGARA